MSVDTAMSVDTMILGVGNLLLGDDAIGVWAAQSLRRGYTFSHRVEVIEGGTLGLALLPRLYGIQRLIVVDAVRLGGRPGDIVRLEDEQLTRAFEPRLSSHEVGLMDLLGAARLAECAPRHVVLRGMEPESLAPGVGFSAVVAAALPVLLAGVLGELLGWSIEARPVPGLASDGFTPVTAIDPRG